ncbi:MAG: hypothetical protein Q9218_004648 [Villophora microphyllina]
MMASNRTEAGQVISAVAQAEGGTTKGSKSAQMQSELSKQRNFEEVSANVGSKLDAAPSSITKEDAQAVHGAETRVSRGQQPLSGSISSHAQHEAAVNKGATTTRNTTASLDPTTQSQLDRQANYEDAASKVGGKLVNEPGNITKEEADTLHSREQRAFGTTEKGGLASQAQHQVAENEGATTTGQSTTASTNPNTQSQLDRQANFEEAAAEVGSKLASNPESITKEDGDLLHSREHRAFGATQTGGLAAQTQHQAAENAKP